MSELPAHFFCHYQKSLEKDFLENFTLQDLGTHLKMDFQSLEKILVKVDADDCFELTEKNEGELLSFYKISYPDNYFGSHMLATGKYLGVRVNNELKAVAGVHVYSKEYRIAVLGNITTHPDMRSRGLGKRCVFKLLSSLIEEVDYIGLNVKADNHPAIKVYTQLGFKTSSQYQEAFFEKIR